jgi:DNA repair protein RecO (recombination protein O)
LFNCYASTIGALSTGQAEAAQLRRFEKRLLEELGYGVDFSRTDGGDAVTAGGFYRVRPQGAVMRCEADAPEAVCGSSLIELSIESFENVAALRDAKKILRAAIEACLDGRALGSREVMKALHRREQG